MPLQRVPPREESTGSHTASRGRHRRVRPWHPSRHADHATSLFFRSLMGTALALMLGMMAACVSSCGRAAPAASETRSTSVEDLLKFLPNLNAIGVTSADYTVTKSSASRGVPSPSDTRIELLGTADLSEDAAKKLQQSFEWVAAHRARIPVKILAILPSGDYLASSKLNDSFSENPTYAHGRVVVVAGNWGRLYFLASDMDHPIE